MLSSLVKLHFKSADLTKLVGYHRFYSDNFHKSDEKVNMILSEPQPRIPPNLGFIGDENSESVFTMQHIKGSFKLG